MTDNWQALLTPEIQSFLHEHHNDDVRALALKKPPNPEWPYPLILDQIKARQKTKTKIPTWHETNDIIFPPSDTLEQASSEPCAKYKASLFKGESFVDLTGGAGIDSWAMLKNFDNATIIDIDQNASERIAHNIRILNKKPASVKNVQAEEFVSNMQTCDLAIIDPQRRNTKRRGLYKLEDCSPNIFDLIPKIKAKNILLKTSPMLDINQAIEQLQYVSAVHVIEWQSECKELLFILTPNVKTSNIPVTAISLNDDGTPKHTLTFTREEEHASTIKIDEPLNYLYEPGPAFTKSGAFKTIANKFNLAKIHPQTHLYTSKDRIEIFPGRTFEIIQTLPVQAKAIPFKKANLTTRNFPQDVQTLRKKLKLAEGGDDYLFACTITDKDTDKNHHTLLHTRKEYK